MKCLEKGRERRYETASGLARDIERYLADEPVEARPPSAGYRLRKFLRRNKGPVVAVALVLVALLAGVVGTALGLARAVDERKKADIARETAQDNETKALQAGAQLRDARDELWANLYASRAAQIQAAWDASQYGRVRELLAAQVPAAGQRDLRGFEWHYLDRQINADLRTVLLPRARSHPTPISPDGTRLLRYVEDADAIWLKSFDTSTGREVLALRMPTNSMFDASFSTDGKWIVASVLEKPVVGLVTDLDLRRWNAVTGTEDLRLRGIKSAGLPLSGPEGLPLLCREPGGQGVQLGSPEKPFEFSLWDGQAVKTVSTPLNGVNNRLALSPDGGVLAVRAWGGEVKLLDVRTCKVLLDTNAKVIPWYAQVAFSSDGRRVAIAGETLTVWEVTTGRQVLEVKEKVQSPVFSPDGSRIAYISAPSSVTLSGGDAKIVDAATGQVRRVLRGHDGRITNLAFTRDGTVLVTAGGDRIKHWDATIDDRVPAHKDRTVGAMAMSAPNRDASRLTRSGMGGFQVWGRGEKPIFTSPASKFGAPPLPLPAPVLPLPPGQPGPTTPKVGPPDVKADPKTPKPAPQGPIVMGTGVVGLGPSHISPDGRRVVWWNHRQFEDGGKELWESELQLWDPDAGRKLVGFVRAGRIMLAGFSPDSRRLAAVVESPGEVKVWDADNGRELFTLPLTRGQEFKLAFSPDGRRLGVIGSADAAIVVGLWDVESGQSVPSASFPLRGWKPQNTIFPPAFDFGARRVAVPLQTDVGPGLTTGIVRVWDVETGSRPVDLKGFKGSGVVGQLAFSPDGHRLAMVSEGKVKLWDPDTGAELLAITVDGGGIEHLAFTADGHAIDLVVRTHAGFETRRLDATPRAGANAP
jgi:WD40 repeat protein